MYNKVMYKLETSERIRNIETKFDCSINELLYDLHRKKNLRHWEIGKTIGVPRPTVTKWFYHFNIAAQSRRRFTDLNLEKHREWLKKNKKVRPKKEFPWHFNKNFFDKWSEEMAYVLGFLIADGYVFTNPRGSNYFGFCSADKEIIEKIRKLLGSNHKIGVKRKRRLNPNWKDSYVLQIGNKKIVKNLRKFGIVQNKSLIINFPKNIPIKFLRHFTRGYFDGDGCVWFGFCKKSNRKKLSATSTTRFTCGNRTFLEDLLYYLKRFSKVNGGSILFKKGSRGYDLSFRIKDGIKIYNFMYEGVDSSKYLERKYDTFQRIINYRNNAGVA